MADNGRGRGRGRGRGKGRGGQDKKVKGKRKEGDVPGRQKRVEQPYGPDGDQERKPGRSGETPPTRERRDEHGGSLDKKEPVETYQNQQNVQGREEKRAQSTEVQSSEHKSTKCKEEDGVQASKRPMAEQTLLTSQQSNQPQGGGKKERKKKSKGTKKEEHEDQPTQESTAQVKVGYAQGASNTSAQRLKTPEKDGSSQSVTPLTPPGTPNTAQHKHTLKSPPAVVMKGDTSSPSTCTPPSSTNTSPGDQSRKIDRLATSNPPRASKGLIIHVLMVHFLS